jgi:catechol 2,3-dioxygenase-like lactoylglutathione lyase family enzyme
MTKLSAFVVLVLMAHSFAQSAPKRPKITAIDHVDFYTTSPEANQKLYSTILGLATAPAVEPGQTQRYMAGSQWVGYSAAPEGNSTNRLDHAAFRTEDAEGLRKYLAAKGVKTPDSLTKWKEGSLSFIVKDPEGNSIEFVQPSRGKLIKIEKAGEEPPPPPDPVSRRMIHVGFVVHDRAAQDHFYKDILGFRPYWYGGMHPERTDWVALQVPDGSDWLEYMLNVKPDADLRTVGVMNHISLGVKDMNAAQMKIESHGWTPSATEHSQIGRDGKLQLNVFDPDLTRIELMEFRPVDKPCCSEFTAPHPSED